MAPRMGLPAVERPQGKARHRATQHTQAKSHHSLNCAAKAQKLLACPHKHVGEPQSCWHTQQHTNTPVPLGSPSSLLRALLATLNAQQLWLAVGSEAAAICSNACMRQDTLCQTFAAVVTFESGAIERQKTSRTSAAVVTGQAKAINLLFLISCSRV